MKKTFLSKFGSSWRYYNLSREDYEKCMKSLFPENLHGIWITSFFLALFLIISSLTLLPQISDIHIALVRRGLVVAAANTLLGIGCLALAIFSRHKYKQYLQGIGKQTSNALIYFFIIIIFIAIIITGVHQSVWSNVDGRAVLFMVFLVAAFFLITSSPVFSYSFLVAAIVFFIINTVIFKEPSDWIMDLLNLIAVVPIALAYNWYVNFYRMSAKMSEIRLKEQSDQYRIQSTIDELTQLKNRRDFTNTFKRFLTNYRESDKGKYLSLAIIDIDHFKNYNDHYGHPQGDECLRAIGDTLGALRECSNVYAARVGGEEFALLWFEENIDGVKDAVKKIQQRINDLGIAHEKSDTASHVTVSIGVHAMLCGASDDAEVIYSLADGALYDAKTGGRNCAVVIFMDEKYHMSAL